jgi:hypothetical protein
MINAQDQAILDLPARAMHPRAGSFPCDLQGKIGQACQDFKKANDRDDTLIRVQPGHQRL